ncbi:beta-ketoacyl-ACP synthase III [Kitasatospora putterlickiae]|uniref:Beta-ketoacyl-[acyl-carrier-protein] synthase III n=1 Tax=Kitasatospora putterlickiae TaxID=221725 RepID=A0ABN1Y4F3_9ACTN
MNDTRPRSAVLAGIGHWLPPTVMTNEELAVRVAVTAEWLRSRTGIAGRHVADAGMATSDLAVEAGRRAMESAAAGEAAPDARNRIDTVVVATTTPDRITPATAPEVATRLGLTGAAAFDLAAACSGFLYGLAVADGLVAAGTAQRVLVVGAETLTSIVDPTDPATSAIFADGAGAAVVRAGRPHEPGAIRRVVLGSDGAGSDWIAVPGGGARHPVPGAHGSGQQRYLKLAGPEVFRNAVRRMTAAAREALARAGWEPADVDRVIAHQANVHILLAVRRKLGIPPERMAANIQHVGNTSAASIPVLLAQDAAEGRIKPGDRLLLAAFGAGFTWAATTLVWPELPGTARALR